MTVVGIECPKCEKCGVVPVGTVRAQCNRCGHVWSIASPKEKAEKKTTEDAASNGGSA